MSSFDWSASLITLFQTVKTIYKIDYISWLNSTDVIVKGNFFQILANACLLTLVSGVTAPTFLSLPPNIF